MIVGKHSVDYSEEGHRYLVDGRQVPSVTQLVKFKFPNKYNGVNTSTLQSAAEKGTELHNAIEIYEQDGLERDDLIEFRNYKFLKQLIGWETVESETMVVLDYNNITIAGRLDQLQMQNGLLGIADIKRTSVLDKEYLAYQLNLYRLAYMQTYGKEISFLRAIHLHDDKRKAVDIKINEKLTYELLEEYERSLTNEH